MATFDRQALSAKKMDHNLFLTLRAWRFLQLCSSYRSLRKDAVPSIVPFVTPIATKKAKGRTARVSQGELSHEKSSISSSIEHYTSRVSKDSKGTTTEPADNSTQGDDDMRVCNCKQVLN